MAHLKTQSEFLFIGRGDDSFLENYSYELESNVEEGGRLFISLEISNNHMKTHYENQ